MEIIGIIAAFLLGLIIGEIRLKKFQSKIDRDFAHALGIIEKGAVNKYRKDN